MRVALAVEDLLLCDCLNFNVFSILNQNFVTNRWNFMKLIVNIYDDSVVMHVTFHQGSINYRVVIAL